MQYAKDTAAAINLAKRYLKLAEDRGFDRVLDEGEATPINLLIEALHYATQAGTSWWPSRRAEASRISYLARDLLLDNTNGYTAAWNDSLS